MKKKKLSITFLGAALLFGACAPSMPEGGSAPVSANVEERREEPTGMDVELPSLEQGSTTVSSAVSPEGSKTKKGKDRELSPPEFPYDTSVDVTAELTPQCVEPGAEIELTVNTEVEAAVGYHAIYAGNKGGAVPPFGEGYGGNDQGVTDDEGVYTSMWVVRVDAPRGPGRIDVVVGWEGQFGYTSPRFAVADEQGNCSQRWLRGNQ